MSNWIDESFNWANPLDYLMGLGYAVDTPWAMGRNVLAGEDPTKGLFNPQERTTGREMLESWGVLDENQPGMDVGDVAGFGVEMLDPLSLLGGMWVGKAAKAAKTARAAKATKGATKGLQRAAKALKGAEEAGGLAKAAIPAAKAAEAIGPQVSRRAAMKAGAGAAMGTAMSPLDMVLPKAVKKALPIIEHGPGPEFPYRSSRLSFEEFMNSGAFDPEVPLSAKASRALDEIGRLEEKEFSFMDEATKAWDAKDEKGYLHYLQQQQRVDGAIEHHINQFYKEYSVRDAAHQNAVKRSTALAPRVPGVLEELAASGAPKVPLAREGLPRAAEATKALPAPFAPTYSRLDRAAQNLPENIKAESLPNMLKKLAGQEGVAQEELDWVLGGMPKKGVLKKRDILKHIDENKIVVEEKVYGTGERLTVAIDPHTGSIVEGFDNTSDAVRFARANGLQVSQQKVPTGKWQQYATPGGENYRELLLKLPEQPPQPLTAAELRQAELLDQLPNSAQGWMAGLEDVPPEYQAIANELNHLNVEPIEPVGFTARHWPDDPNTFAHIRFDDRRAADGTKTLFVQELQSDWHQTGAKQGYKGVPREMKWVKDDLGLDTQQRIGFSELYAPSGGADPWAMSLGKRAEDGKYEWWDFNTGESRGVFDTLERAKKAVSADPANIRLDAVPNAPFKGDEWAKLALKKMLKYATDNGYDRIAWNNGELAAKYAGGGATGETAAGIARWYDETLPNIFKKLAGKEGAKYEPMVLNLEEGQHLVHSFTVPQATKKRIVSKGQPLLNVLPWMAGLGAGVGSQAPQFVGEEEYVGA